VSVTTVLFDVGGVVVLTPFELTPGLERRRGLERGVLQLDGPYSPGGDSHWARVLSGEAHEDTYWRDHAQRLKPLLDLEGDDPTQSLIAALFEGSEVDVVRPEIAPTLDELHDLGLRTAVLSNHLTLFHDPALISSVLSRFEPVIDLSFSTFRKPDPRAFARAIAALGDPDPTTVLHVDDLPVHVAGAEAAGLQGFRFDPKDPARSFADLIERTRR
jgi:putative hydrolase of the HAD superfamily